MNLYVKKHGQVKLCCARQEAGFRPGLLLKNQSLFMKISLLAVFLTISGLLTAGSSDGQDLNKIMVSIELKNTTLKNALRKIESLAKLPFTYKTNDVAGYDNISYQADNISVAHLLEDLLRNTDLQYEQVNTNIVIKKVRANTGKAATGNNVSGAVTSEDPFEGTIKGRVTNLVGEPVPNASIILAGTEYGTAADARGEFTLTGIPAGNYRLQVTAIGYGTLTRNVTVRDNEVEELSLQLADDNSNLEEVVVTALGIRREKKSLGYSAQEVKGEDLANTRQTNIVNALRGKVAGVQINSGGGAPGQGTRIIIRGIKSLNPSKDNQPLFVIDGIIIDNSTYTVSSAGSLRGLTNRAADINPDDIETISILKGGAATALYGQAGSAGVVVITTKSAQAGKMRVNLTSTYGIDEVNKFPDVQRTFSQGYIGTYNPNDFWPSWGPTAEEAKALDPTHPDRIYDHYAQGYKTGNQFRSSINLSGGTEKSLLSSSFSYFKQNGAIPNSDYKSISARLGGQFKFGKMLKLNPGLYFINSGGYRVNADRYNESLTYWSPRWDVMDYIKPDGTMKTYGNNNPVFGTYINRFKDNVNRIIGNVAATFSPFPWLDIDYKLGMDYYSDFRRHAGPGPKGLAGEIHYEDNGLGFVDEYRISSRLLNSNAMITFKKDWTSKFSSVLRAGNEVRDRRYSRLTASGSELDIPDLLSLNNAKVRSTTQYEEQYRIVSAYGDLLLSWDDFLFLNVTGRNEWSSTLSKENNSFFYPSLSLSYVFSDHFLMPHWISFGKLRASYAEIGKDTDPYEINTYYGSGVITSSGQVTWTRSDIKGDPSLQPERTSTIEAGAEMKLFNNRLGFDFTWYKLNSRDLIIPVSLSPTTGFTSFILNAGEIENKGIELVLSGTPVQTKDFTWEASLNFTRNRNKVVKIREGLTEIVVGSHFGYVGATATLKYVPGYAVGNIYGTSYQRYYGSKDDDGVTVDKSLPIVILEDGSNRGFPSRNNSQRILGNSQPDWLGGITNTFTYKNFSFSFLWETQQGLDRYNQLANFMAAFGIAKYTENRTESKVFDGVLADGTVNNQLVYLGQGVGPDGRNYNNGYYRNVFRGIAENFVEDASWVRLRNVSLSYNIPKSVFKNIPIQGATVSFTGNNLLLFTNYSGFDPETSSFSAGSNMDGFSGFTYPALRSYLFSVNINF